MPVPALHEQVVIGGGPAGCAAAILMSRAGHDVTLFEKQSVAVDKLCGEFISWEAAHYLQGLDLDLPALGAELIEAVRLYDGATMIETPLPLPGWGLSRRVLDQALLKRAEASGAVVNRGCALDAMTSGDKGWTLTAGPDNLHARTVFLASGRHEANDLPQRRNEPDCVSFKMHLRLVPTQYRLLRQAVEVFLFDKGYAALELVEDGKANLCLCLSRQSYLECGGNWTALLGWVGRLAPIFKMRIAGAQPLWPQPLAALRLSPGYLHRPYTKVPRLYRIGDQLAATSSFAGDGIALALHSAFLAVRTHLEGDDVNAYYRQVWAQCRRPLRAARVLADLMATAEGRNAAFVLAQLLPGLMILTLQHVRLAQADILPAGATVAAGIQHQSPSQQNAVKH